MKQETYNTRFRAQELLQETVSIWRQGDHMDQLEGLEKDPIFSIFLTALAYQANETDSEIERLRQDVLDEFARLLIPYEVGHALPATAVVETELKSGVTELMLTEKTSFRLEDSGFTFMPLLRSRVVNVSVNSIVRLDGRRWKMTLSFREPVSDLTGITFAIKDARFKNLRVRYNGSLLPLVKPWQYENMPLQPCFSVESLLYNHAQMYSASLTGLELYARQNVALFYIGHESTKHLFPIPTDRIELVFDFSDIAEDFIFDKNCFALNAVLLVNATLNTVTLSAEKPLVRLPEQTQLMHLITPAKEQLFGKTPVTVRRVAADRFNQSALFRLVNSLMTKIYSDHYAFLNVEGKELKSGLAALQAALDKATNTDNDKVKDLAGVYLMLEQNALNANPNISLNIDYLSTFGAAVNDMLSSNSHFAPPAGFEESAVQLIAPPSHGFDEVNNSETMQQTLRYHMVTNDRIVTPADVKLFCYNELANRYSIGPEMVNNIIVKHHYEKENSGYGIYVTIDIASNRFVQRSFTEKIPQAQMLLQKQMEVRSSHIYPIYVTIHLIESNNE